MTPFLLGFSSPCEQKAKVGDNTWLPFSAVWILIRLTLDDLTKGSSSFATSAANSLCILFLASFCNASRKNRSNVRCCTPPSGFSTATSSVDNLLLLHNPVWFFFNPVSFGVSASEKRKQMLRSLLLFLFFLESSLRLFLDLAKLRDPFRVHFRL